MNYPSQLLDDFNGLHISISSIPLSDFQSWLNDWLKEDKKLKISQKEIKDSLMILADNWLDPDNPIRLEAEKLLPFTTGYSISMIQEILTITFQEFQNEKFDNIIRKQTLESTLDGLITHILAGNIFTSGLFGIIYGLLAGKKQLVKLSGKEPLFPLLFVQSLQKINPILSNQLAITYWKGGNDPMEDFVIEQSNRVIAYGNDSSIESIKRKIKSPALFYGFGNKFSFGILGKEIYSDINREQRAENIATDVSLYDQQGCLSPHLIFIEKGNNKEIQDFLELLKNKMIEINQRLPRGKISLSESARILQMRGTYEFRKSKNSNIMIYSSSPGTDWTIVYTDEPGIQLSCLNRFLFIKPYSNLDEIIDSCKPWIGKIQSVGLGFDTLRENEIINKLQHLGIHRICELGKMQKPGIDEFHSGKPNPEDFI